MQDAGEITPEFFFFPEFLLNVNGLEFGQTEEGELINSIKLPDWAKDDPRVFVML